MKKNEETERRDVINQNEENLCFAKSLENFNFTTISLFV